MKNFAPRHWTFTSVAFALFAGGAVAQQGHVLNGVGAVNQGMAGVATGLATDGSGAINWNPASITAIDCCDMQFSMELFSSDLEMYSSMGNPAPPPKTLEGSTDCGRGPSAIPSFAMVHDLGDSGWTFGLGAFGVAGFGVDFEADAANPILSPGGFGQVFSEYQLLQVTPTFSKKIDEHWSFGFAPTINQARLRVHPAPFASPNPDMTYPSAMAGDDAWGFGGQLGVFYDSQEDWTFGASYKSTQKFESFTFNAIDNLGAHRTLKFDMDFPAIASVGIGYKGIDDWKFGLDLRHIDYESTAGFDESGFDATGAVKGFGWDNVNVLALAAEWQATPGMTLRGGMSFNNSPIDEDNAGFNIAAPAIIEQHLALGATFDMGEHMKLDLAWHHGFENDVSGPMQNPAFAGGVPGSSVQPTMSTDSIVFGLRLAL